MPFLLSVHAEPVVGTFATIQESVVPPGQLVVIRIAPHPDRALTFIISDGTNNFRYNGQAVSSTIGFQAQRTGEHTLSIKDASTGETIETLHFLVGDLPTVSIAPIEPIATLLNSTSGNATSPNASSENATNQTISSANTSLNITGNETANATLNITGNATTSSENETVLPTRTQLVQTDKSHYAMGESVHVLLLTNDTAGLRLNIVKDDAVLRFLGEMSSIMTFEPNAPGAYRVVVSGEDGAAIDSFVFVVDAPAPASPPLAENATATPPKGTAPAAQTPLTPLPTPPEPGSVYDITAAFQQTAQRYRIRNADGRVFSGILSVKDSNGERAGPLLEAQATAPNGTADIMFTPDDANSPIKRIKVVQLLGASLDLGVDDLGPAKTPLPYGIDDKGHMWTAQYAIDPSTLNASSIEATVTASGTALYTCKDWDFANRQCLGAWVKVRDLTPGENYTLTLTSADPGFGETIPIPSGGWTKLMGTNTMTARLCKDMNCVNTSTVFNSGDLVYVMVNTSTTYIQNNTLNQLDVYYGSDTTSIATSYYFCRPSSAYTSCVTNFTIGSTWDNGWYYLSSEQYTKQGSNYNGVFSFRTPFIVGSEPPAAGDSFRYFVDSGYTRETSIFGNVQQVYVEINFSGWAMANVTTSTPIMHTFQDRTGTGTAITESWSNTTGPYRFNFSMPVLASGTGWYYLEPLMKNTSSAAIPDGNSVHGRMILYQNNSLPALANVTTNSPFSAPKSVGQSIIWNFSISDSDEVDRWVIFICNNNSFNNATMACGGQTICSNTTYSPLLNRSCTVLGNRSMNITNQHYAFACDARNCTGGRPINWSINNDTTSPYVSLIAPPNDVGGTEPQRTFNVTFNYVPADNYDLANCSIYTNSTGSWNIANTSASITNGTNNLLTVIFNNDGSYKWNVQCYDYAGQSAFNNSNFTVFVVGPPLIRLGTPPNNTYTNSNSVSFVYNVSYGGAIDNCSIYMNGTFNQSNQSPITQNANQSFGLDFSSDGSYAWAVRCDASDGNYSFSDGVYNVSTNRTLFIDSGIPNVTLQSPGDQNVINVSSVTFIYSANDTFAVANCTLNVDTVDINTVTAPQNNANQSVPFLLNNGLHVWYATCTDYAGNAVTSGTRTVTVNSSAGGAATFYETDYIAGPAYTPTASINLSTVIDASEEAISGSTPFTTTKTYALASSSPLQGNGILIYNTTANFSGDFTTRSNGDGIVTWTLFKSNSSGDTVVAQSGNGYGVGTLITGNTRQTARNSTTANLTRLLGTEWLKLKVEIYNPSTKFSRTIIHHIDTTNSYVMFNFTRLGVLTADITVPGTNLSVAINDTFSVTCAINCSGGDCMNVRAYVERNTTAGWTAVNGTTGILLLNGTETNPHNYTTVAYPGNSTTFILLANATGSSLVRCNATSNYSNILTTTTRRVTVGSTGYPTIEQKYPSNNAFLSTTSIGFIFLPTSNKALLNCSVLLDGTLNTSNTTPVVKDANNTITINGINEGTHTWSVRCYDQNNSVGNSTNRTFTIDQGPPSVALNAPGNYSNFTTNIVDFNWTAADTSGNSMSCNLTLNSVIWARNVTSPNGVATNKTLTNLTIGLYSWNVTCADLAGNRNTSETWILNITNLPTNVTLLAPGNATWNNSATIDFRYNVTHPTDRQPANCSLYINGTLNATNSTPIALNQTNNFSLNTLSDGHYSWYVRCVDIDGTANASATRSIFVDKTKPSINLTYPADNASLSIFNIPFMFNATDNLAPNMTCNLTLDGVVNVTNFPANSSRNTTRTVNSIADGTHYWNVTCDDLAGNRNTSATYNFTTVAPPVVNLTYPGDNAFVNSSNINLTYNVSENNVVANCSLYINGLFNQTNATPVNNYGLNNFSLYNLPQGTYYWNVTCTDGSGYPGNSSTRNFTIDTTKPTVALNAPNNITLRTGTVVVNWTAYDNIDWNLSCNVSRYGPTGLDNSKVNIGSLNGSLTSTTYSGLTDGQHWWNVSCRDDANNTNISVTYTFNVSRVPTVGLNSPPNLHWNNSAAINLTYTPYQSQGLANCSLYLNGTFNQTNQSPIANNEQNNFTLTNLPEGTYNWSVNCTDTTGGSENSSTRTLYIDRTLPTITLYQPNPGDALSNNTVRFNYSVNDNMGTRMLCNLTIDGTVYGANAPVNNNGVNNSYVLLHGGNATYLWNVTCLDNASNSNTSETRNFTLWAPPLVVLLTPGNNSPVLDDINFTYRPTDPYGFTNCSLYLDGSLNASNSTPIANASNNTFYIANLTFGNHQWTVGCYDTDGDYYMAPPFSISVDSTAPIINLTAPGNLSNFTLGNVTFNWTAYDDYSANISCALYIDSAMRSNQSKANNSAYNATATLLPDGDRYWNVTCWDQVQNSNTSETRVLNVNETPKIALTGPANNNLTNSTTVRFQFRPTDNDGYANCSLFINNTRNTTNTTIINNAVNNLTINLTTGQYTWYIECVDNGTYSNANVSDTRNLTVNLQPPSITLNAPADGNVSAVSWLVFNWTANDTFGGNLTCNLTINGTVRAPNVNTPSGSQNVTRNITALNDSFHAWNVTCIDPAGNRNTSSTWNFTITEPPNVTLNGPPKGLRTNNLTINFTFTPTDNSGLVANCTLVLNNITNTTISVVNNSVVNNITVPGFVNGTYFWYVNCSDTFDNVGQSETRNLSIDTYPPDINLTNPPHDSLQPTNVTFNWTAVDTGAVVTCNLTLDGVVNISNIVGSSFTPFSKNISNIQAGPHYWNVTCWDDLLIANTSETRNFTVNSADLVLNDSARIGFNSTNPNENDTLNITANVSNFGGVIAANAVISFWDGLPNAGGIPIGNVTRTLSPNTSVVVSVAWNITLGLHEIFVSADPDGVITEMDKSNNNATRNISVLRVLINAPPNATMTNNQTPGVNFTIQDFTGGTFTWRVFVDGTGTALNDTAQDNVSTVAVLNSLSEGIHRVIIQANDTNRSKNSTALTLIIDLTAPSGALLMANNTFFRESPLNVTLRVNDTFDPVLNYTIYVNGTANTSNTTNNATATNATLSGLANNAYLLTLESWDDAGNHANATPIVIWVDNIPPSITLLAPPDGANFSNRTVALNYTVSDNLDPVLQCNLTLDGTVVSANRNVTNGANDSYNATGLPEGMHTWNVTCWDGNNAVTQVNNVNTSSPGAFNVYIPPNINLIAPANNTINNTADQVFLFNVSDETGLTNCSLLLNGAISTTKTTAQLILNSTNNFTASGLNNTNIWAVTCTDNSTGLATNTTGNRTLYIDLVAPVPMINTAPYTWFNTGSPSLNITITDNFALTLNWTFFANGNLNTNGTIANGTPTLKSLSGLSNGTYSIILQGTDTALNRANTSALTIYVDTARPNVTLLTPANGTNISDTTVTMNFTASDNMAQVLLCNLTLDSNASVAQYNLTNGTNATYTATNLIGGWHSWNATCVDNATNRGTSETWRFYVQLPDLAVTTGNITFSNGTPIENDNLTVNAMVFNIGLLNATSITVQFWRGDPDAGGTQLGANQTIAALGIGENVTLSQNITALIGLNQVYVVVDPPTTTNGSIRESNESNNKANNDFWVGLYEVFAGGSTNDLLISDNSIIAAFSWNQTNVTGSNVFVADSESSVSFTSLQAIGRNTTNGTDANTQNDFTEIDTKLNTTTLNDSINRTFTSAGAPRDTMDLTAFKRRIDSIPVVNSTNTSTFRTGILWDTSDGGLFYNSSQDIAFVTIMNQSQEGQYGTYDYEIKVPAKLRDYVAGGNTVTFYTELR